MLFVGFVRSPDRPVDILGDGRPCSGSWYHQQDPPGCNQVGYHCPQRLFCQWWVGNWFGHHNLQVITPWNPDFGFLQFIGLGIPRKELGKVVPGFWIALVKGWNFGPFEQSLPELWG